MEILIRDAAASDLDALEGLEKACFSDPWSREVFAAQLPDERHEFLVAECGGRLLGYVTMMCVLDEGDISNVAVEPGARRNGIGRELVSEMLRRAERRSLAAVMLEVREHNEAAIALYDEAGFVPVGRRRGYYEHPREDAILMTLWMDKEEKA